MSSFEKALKNLPLYVYAKDEWLGGRGQEKAARIPMKVFVTASNIDEENQTLFLNITYKKVLHQMYCNSHEMYSDSISIEVHHETVDIKVNKVARGEFTDAGITAAIGEMFNWLIENGYLDKDGATIEHLYKDR